MGWEVHEQQTGLLVYLYLQRVIHVLLLLVLFRTRGATLMVNHEWVLK